ARDVDGRRPPEIAAALGLSLGAVDSLLLRARRRLAASVESMSADGGAASFMTTAAVSAVGGSASQMGGVAKVVQLVGNTVATVSYHVAAAIGMVPGMPSLASQAAPVAAAGLVSLTPAVGNNVDVPEVPPIPALTATVPVTSPPSPALATPKTDAASENVAKLLVSTVPLVSVDPGQKTSAPVATAPVVEPAPTLLGEVGDAVSGTLRGVVGQPSAR
ncbi:MAG: sigma factor-like helix-turn-helix DNA-binding protein, partial [Acidimicrobiales bacterium]|nr:sigma factor-like helix-turn-helix DNA-binding protein [Acidimicrobiales bacterium]